MMQNKHEDSITTHSANNKDTVDFNEDKKQSSQIKTKGRDRRKLLFQILAGTISISSFLLIWQLSTTFTGLGDLMPGPFKVLTAFFLSFTQKIGKYTILQHTWFSLVRVLVAYTAALILGVTLGMGMGRIKLIEAIFRPFYEVIRPIPPIAWISLSILWFGLGEMTKYFIIFLSAFASITYTAFSGTRAVNSQLIGAAKMLGANDRQVFTTVILPASVPYIFAGMQVAISSSWATVVAAEMVRSSEGLGWIIVSGMEVNNMQQILVGIVAIGIMGFVLEIILHEVELVLFSWNRGGV